MKLYTTEIITLDGRKWSGPRIPGITFEDAQNYCENNGLGYCTVSGELIAEIDYHSDEKTDYENQHLN